MPARFDTTMIVAAAAQSGPAHAETLVRLAAGALDQGRPDLAFPFADRLCRLNRVAAARHRLLRAVALAGMGETGAAEADLDRADELAAADPIVQRSILRHHPKDAVRTAAARSLVANPQADHGDRRAALRWLDGAGERVLLRADRTPDGVSGTLYWKGPGSAEIRVEGEAGADLFLLDADPGHPLAGALGCGSDFRIAVSPSGPLLLHAAAGGATAPPLRLYAQAHAVTAPPRIPPDRAAPVTGRAGSRPRRVHVIVPVHGDFTATRACLNALREQRTTVDLRVTVIDDHSPDAAIRAFVRDYCRSTGARLIVNALNHGFAGSVNKALAGQATEDVLLLNADVVLPADAIERLAAAADNAPGVGVVAPLSNDSEYTSFPEPYRPNALPDAERRAEIDRAADLANGHGVVDLPSCIGFCLWITRACLDAVGPLSPLYGRGYYEDVEFCLAAQERGFRTVAAIGLYVGHASGRSFGNEKQGLVARNGQILEARHPGHGLRTAAFLDADPLAAARSAIEARLPPKGPVILLVGRAERLGPVLERRAADLADGDAVVITLGWRGRASGLEVTLRAGVGQAPRSLSFVLDAAGRRDFAAYLDRLETVGVELAEAAATPQPLLDALTSRRLPVRAFVADRDSFEAVTADGPSLAVVPADRMVRARSGAPLDRRPVPYGRPARREVPRASPRHAVIAVLVPVPDPEVDHLLRALGRDPGLRGRVRFVVLGRTLADLQLMAAGTIFVTGRMTAIEWLDALRHHAAHAVFSPHRTRFFGLLDDLAASSELPKAYFDWSEGAMAPAPDDLALEPDLCAADVGASLGAWCGRLSGP